VIRLFKAKKPSEPKPYPWAEDFLLGLKAKDYIEDLVGDLLKSELYAGDFVIGGDLNDYSLEVYFLEPMWSNWKPSERTLKALREAGFSGVFWNFNDGTEIRPGEERRKKPHA